MTPYKNRMNKYIRRMAEDMQLRNFADATIDAYTYQADKFCQYFGKTADQLGPEEIREYQLYLVNASADKTHRRRAGPTAHRRGQGAQGTFCSGVAETAAGTSRVLENRSSAPIPVPRQDILPKGYTRSRSYGGFHCRKRERYLALCRELLDISDQATQPSELTAPPEPSLPTCKKCKVNMVLVESSPRPSWRTIFEVTVYRESNYAPTLHIHFGGIPNAHPFPRDG